jgi:surface antigen
LAALLVVGLLAATPARALQCVPYARVVSGIDLRGDAWKWWNAAAGAYERGHAPRLGAVLVFRKHGHMRLGHVAVVAKMIDSRTMMIDHANWGPRGAGRGTVSKMVPLRDVSASNDWSQVQVWNAITRDFGTQTYPTYGFIYPRGQHPLAHEPSVADLPEDVAAMLALEAPAEPQPDAGPIPGFVLAADIAPLEAVPVPEVQYEPLASAVLARAGTSEIWADDRAAALRAGSGRY